MFLQSEGEAVLMSHWGSCERDRGRLEVILGTQPIADRRLAPPLTGNVQDPGFL